MAYVPYHYKMYTLAVLHLFTFVNRVTCSSLMGYLGISLHCVNDGTATDIAYTTFGFMISVRVTFVKENDMLVNKPDYDENSRWIFREVTKNIFRWQNVTIMENDDWRINANIYSKRK